MDRPFPAYKGEEPYIFVSYAHKDADLVYAELQHLHDLGLNIWYDDGIRPGSRWSDALADALWNSSLFLYFVTPRSVASQNCLDEVSFALEKGKSMLAIHLEATQLPSGLSLRLGSRQAIMKYQLAEKAYREKLADTLVACGSELGEVVHHEADCALDGGDRIYASMAVLPFECRSDDTELREFGEMLAEEIAHRIGSNWMGVRIVSGRETRRYADRDATSREVCAGLNVGMVLRGVIRKMGGQVRIIPELVGDAGQQIWTHRFDVQLDTLTDEEERITNTTLVESASSRATFLRNQANEAREQDLGPWGLIWRANNIELFVDPKRTNETIRLTRRATELAPQQPLFSAYLAFWLASGVMQGFSLNKEEDAAEALRHAEIGATWNHADALVNAGLAFGFLGDHARGLALCKRAYEIAGQDLNISNLYAGQLLWSGDARQALSIFMRDEELRLPRQLAVARYISQCYAVLGDLESAREWGRKGVDQRTEPLTALSCYANVLARQDRIEDAARVIDELKRIFPRYRLLGSIKAYRRVYADENAGIAVTQGLQKLVDLGYE